jgi:hypothetical protein
VVAAIGLAAFSEGTPQRYENAEFGFSLTVPERFREGNTKDPRHGRLWVSEDGQARLIAVATRNEAGMSLSDYRAFVIEQTYKGAEFDHSPVRSTWFVLTGRVGSQEFYERITFACGGRYIYGWQMLYPVSSRKTYDRIVEAVHRSFRAGRGEDGNCGRSQ